MPYCHHYLLVISMTLTSLLSGVAVSLYGLICVRSVLDLDWLLVADNGYYNQINDLLLVGTTSCPATNNSTPNLFDNNIKEIYILPAGCSTHSLLIYFLYRSFTLCFLIFVWSLYNSLLIIFFPLSLKCVFTTFYQMSYFL